MVLESIESIEREVMIYPELDKVLLVEEFIQEHSGEFKKQQLWRNLPNSVMWQTLCLILDYLKQSHKIALDKEGKIGWIWNPQMVEKYAGKPNLRWRK